MEILDGKKLKEEILTELKDKTKKLNLTLAVIQIGNDESSNIYIRQKEKMCEYLNIKFNLYKYEENTSEEEIIFLIDKLNNDETTGILLQLPIPSHLDSQKILNTIDYKKDVDGLTNQNVTNLLLNKKGLIPCTPKGILTIFQRYNISLEGKNIVIVGRSNLVGKPLSNLLLKENATVTVCHSKTQNLKDITSKADILIVAVGKPNLITEDMVKEGAIVVTVGLSRADGKIVGDVDFERVKDKTNYITPVPGGVGPMTICSLAQNIYEAYILQNE